MQVQGSVDIRAPRNKVWVFLTDPNAVGQCAPGLESMEIVTPGEKFKAIASVGFGSMKVRFTADVTWTALDEPDHAQVLLRSLALIFKD